MSARFLRYAAVGAVSTLLHFAVLTLAVEGAHWAAWQGSAAGALAGAQLAFVGNRWLTFAHRGSWLRAWWRFHVTAALGMALGVAVVALLAHLGAHYLLAQAVATALVLVLGYLVNRRWSFAQPVA